MDRVSPETLISCASGKGFAMALAGTKNIDAQDLEWDEKEMEEHLYVSDFLDVKLEKMAVEVTEKSKPYTVDAGFNKAFENRF